MDNTLEQRVEALEKKIAALEGRVPEQPKTIQMGACDIDEIVCIIKKRLECQ